MILRALAGVAAALLCAPALACEAEVTLDHERLGGAVEQAGAVGHLGQ